jgi:hypothetical protein
MATMQINSRAMLIPTPMEKSLRVSEAKLVHNASAGISSSSAGPNQVFASTETGVGGAISFKPGIGHSASASTTPSATTPEITARCLITFCKCVRSESSNGKDVAHVRQIDSSRRPSINRDRLSHRGSGFAAQAKNYRHQNHRGCRTERYIYEWATEASL